MWKRSERPIGKSWLAPTLSPFRMRCGHFGGRGKIRQETVKYPRRRWPGRAVFGYNDATSTAGLDQRGYHATKMFGSSGDEELA